MTHAITTLEIALRTAENNEPINRREGKVEQADLENQVAIDIRQALALLRKHDSCPGMLFRAGRTVGKSTGSGLLGPPPMQPQVAKATGVDWGGAQTFATHPDTARVAEAARRAKEDGEIATTLERIRLIPHVVAPTVDNLYVHETPDVGTGEPNTTPSGNTTDPNDPRLKEIQSNGQAAAYLVLPEEVLKSDASERPLRFSYIHGKCGGVTSVGGKIALTFAKDPTFYDTTFCCHCLAQFPVADFTWEGTTDVVGSCPSNCQLSCPTSTSGWVS